MWMIQGDGHYRSMEPLLCDPISIFLRCRAASQLRKIVWRLKIPSKMQFFVWTCRKEKLPTIDLLQRRGMILPNMCSLCLQDEELVNHVIIHCPFVCEVWEITMREVGIAWIFPNRLGDLFHGWNMVRTSKKGRLLWSLIYSAMCWSLWLERNQYIFENLLEPASKVYIKAKDYFCFWGC